MCYRPSQGRVLLSPLPALWTALLIALAACSTRPAPEDPAARGEQAFRTYCLGCHGIAPGAPTALGPNLDGIATRAAANPAGLSAEEWLRQAIVDTDAVIAPGYSPGLMPTTYGRDLSEAEIADLVAYMLTLR